ncbi:MAG: putative periplasmic or secreted lipoprotein [Dehalococcoidales bacterium]|nr:putative periplasmic or secreted lipoprotein [Dehalococcoidales bacterium]
MSQRLPALKPREVVSAFEKAGWYVHRQKGSHLIMYKTGTPNMIVIPLHTHDLPRGTLRGILSDAELSVREFLELLKQ